MGTSEQPETYQNNTKVVVEENCDEYIIRAPQNAGLHHFIDDDFSEQSNVEEVQEEETKEYLAEDSDEAHQPRVQELTEDLEPVNDKSRVTEFAMREVKFEEEN